MKEICKHNWVEFKCNWRKYKRCTLCNKEVYLHLLHNFHGQSKENVVPWHSFPGVF